MKRRTALGITFTVMLLILAAGAFRLLRGSASSVDARWLVTKALAPADGSYVARVNTVLEYCGRTIKTNATVYHRGRDEKIEYRGPDNRVVWSMRKGNRTYTFLPRQNKLLVSESGRLLSEDERAQLILKNYEASYQGAGEIAGRPVHIVDLAPRRENQPSKTLWIDRDRYTILRSVDYTASGEERGSTETTRVDYGARVDASRFALPSEASVKRVMVCSSAQSPSIYRFLGFPVNAPRYLPVGYRLEGYHLFNSQCPCDHRSAQLTYTDGLNIISVFETPLMTSCKAGACNMEKCEGSGGCALAGCETARTGQVCRKDKTVVIVGDLSPDEVKKIAESVD